MPKTCHGKKCPKCGKYNDTHCTVCQFCNYNIFACQEEVIDLEEKKNYTMRIVFWTIFIGSIIGITVAANLLIDALLNLFIITTVGTPVVGGLYCLLHVPNPTDKELIAQEISESKIQMRKRQIKTEYEKCCKQIPNDAKQAVLSNKTTVFGLPLNAGRVWLWKSNDSLHIVNCCPAVIGEHDNDEYIKYLGWHFDIASIPLSCINKFLMTGEKRERQYITGGGGGGSSAFGAAVGGAIAGDVGAVIGSRKETAPVETHYVTEDTRVTCLLYQENDVAKELEFHHKTFEILDELIPEKNQIVIEKMKQDKLIQKEITNKVAETLKQLASLQEQGILTEEEFKQKKKDLLDRI